MIFKNKMLVTIDDQIDSISIHKALQFYGKRAWRVLNYNLTE